MAWSVTIGTLFGTKLRIHFTFLIFLIWIGIAYWVAGGAGAALTGLAFILLLFACVVAHEFGHILTARRYGVRTPDVTLLPIGGVARLERIPEKPAQELAVALAGPMVNVVIAGVLILLLGTQALETAMRETFEPADILPRLALANLFLAVFNLVPAFPMDGGRALRAVLATRLPRVRATKVAATVGQMMAFGFALLGLVSGNAILIFIGLFVYFGASAESYDTQMQEIAEGLLVGDAMVTELVPLSPASRLDDAVEILLRTSQHELPVLDGAGKLIGILNRSGLIRAMQNHGGDHPVVEAMNREVPTIGMRHRLADALRLMSGNRGEAVAVVHSDGRFAGLVTSENLGELVMVATAREASRAARAAGPRRLGPAASG